MTVLQFDKSNDIMQSNRKKPKTFQQGAYIKVYCGDTILQRGDEDLKEYEHLFENIHHTTAQKLCRYKPSKIPDYVLRVGLHWHNEFEINIMRDGVAICRIGTEVYELHKGDIVIKIPVILHETHIQDGGFAYYDTMIFHADFFGMGKYERSYIEVLGRLINQKDTIKNPIRPTDKGYDKISSLLDDAVSAAKLDSPVSDILLKSRLIGLLYELVEGGYIVKNEYSAKRDADMEVLQPVLKYIADNYTADIKISHLARLTARSDTAFMALFKKVMGVTAMEYITHLRINASCEMLRYTDQKIIDIAQNCGYYNLSNYNRIFRKKIGVTPKEFRSQFKSAEKSANIMK